MKIIRPKAIRSEYTVITTVDKLGEVARTVLDPNAPVFARHAAYERAIMEAPMKSTVFVVVQKFDAEDRLVSVTYEDLAYTEGSGADEENWGRIGRWEWE